MRLRRHSAGSGNDRRCARCADPAACVTRIELGLHRVCPFCVLAGAAHEQWRSQLHNGVQAKVSELEQQVDELNQRISLQTTEKANLDSRVNILVRVLRMRDEEIAQLQQKLKVGAGVAPVRRVAKMQPACLQNMTRG